MTSKFKNAVKAVVLDGIITKEEKLLLDKVAKEEKVSASDAEVYITQQLKIRKMKLNNPKEEGWFSKNGGTLITAVVSIAGIALKIFGKIKLK